ncbi:hypothetical protein GIB67_030736 [Kingdonia uniflora]|uniref:Alliinase C-terminal domain-containing protein n=1 Tax=Kingdonia uniflora TaxID=39325 RepID=A0A7J7L326_9MAGN|nr:hypothetical protein GIB67_030736 [Kingdonia uniflora]
MDKVSADSTWIIIGVMCLLMLSLLLNSVLLLSKFAGMGMGKGKGMCLGGEKEMMTCPAVKEEVQVSSSSNGSSTTTTVVSLDSIINLDHGDPTMYEAFWRKMGDKSTLVIPGWQLMSYFSDIGNFCWFLEPELGSEIRRLHKLVGNADTEDRYIVVGTGSTQLFQAALYALSPPDATEPINVVSASPYYSSYPSITDFLKSSLYKWAGDANSYSKEGPYIELVTSPNNPDGYTRQSVVNRRGGLLIHDLAYHWPQYTPITSVANHDLMLFTVSKSTGHAGTRIGWALVKDKEVAKRMTKFIELNTIGVSKDSQLRAAKILKAVSDTCEIKVDQADNFFEFGRREMSKRWELLREAVKQSGMFSLPEFTSDTCNHSGKITEPHPAFAWLKCEGEIEDCESFLRGHNILTRNGKHFGMDSKYVRVSMLDREATFNQFVKRLSNMHS